MRRSLADGDMVSARVRAARFGIVISVLFKGREFAHAHVVPRDLVLSRKRGRSRPLSIERVQTPFFGFHTSNFEQKGRGIVPKTRLVVQKQYDLITLIRLAQRLHQMKAARRTRASLKRKASFNQVG